MDKNHFVEKDFQLYFPKPKPLTIHGCKFNQKHYRPELFSVLNVKTPQSMEKMVTKRQAEYLAGRYCADKALNKLQIKNFKINKDQYRCPIWPLGINGSISHTSSLALATASDEHCISGIGIDIEPIVSGEKAKSLKKQILYQSTELELYHQDSDPAFIFTLFFSLKESFFKAAYPQVKRIFDFDAIEILSHHQQQQYCDFRLRKTLSSELKMDQQYKGYYQRLDSSLVTLCVL